MATETTNIGQDGGGQSGQAADAFGSTNWEERLAAAREKRLQVLEERRKSGDFVADSPAIVGPKPWEVEGQDVGNTLTFVEEFEPDEFDYETPEKPEDVETIVLPLSAAVAASDREIDLLAEDEEEEFEEEKPGHFRAIAFIGVGAVIGVGLMFGAGLLMPKNDLPPDFASGSTIDGAGAFETIAATQTQPAAEVVRSNPELPLAEATGTANAAPQPTIESLASDISDDIVAVAVETTLAVNGDEAVGNLEGSDLSETVLVTSNTDNPIISTQTSGVDGTDANIELPVVEASKPLTFPSDIQTDGEIELAGLSNLSVPSASGTSREFNLEPHVATDVASTAPTPSQPRGSTQASASASPLNDGVPALPGQSPLIVAGVNVTSPDIDGLPYELFGGVATDLLPFAPGIAAPSIIDNPAATGPAPNDVEPSQPVQEPLITAGITVTAPLVEALPNTSEQQELLGQAPAITAPSESQEAQLTASRRPASSQPTAQALAATQEPSGALTVTSSQPQRPADAELVAITVTPPASPNLATVVPGNNPAQKPDLQLVALPNTVFSDPPVSLDAPAPRDSLILDIERYVVRMHVPSAVPEDQFVTRAEVLRSGGLKLDTARVDFKISQDQVRYFHPEDATIAEAISQEIGGTVRDFTEFSPSPPSGTVEIWLSGTSAKPAQPARTQARSTRRATTQRAPARQRQVNPADALKQQLTRRLRRGDHL